MVYKVYEERMYKKRGLREWKNELVIEKQLKFQAVLRPDLSFESITLK